MIKKPRKPRQLKREKSTSEAGHYIRNADLLPVVLDAKEKGAVTPKLMQMISMIATRYSMKYNFVKYSYREDMVASAIANLCKSALKFNPEKSSNAFTYYTTAIHNSFLQYMNDEKVERDIRDTLLLEAGSNPSFNFLQQEMDEHHFEISDSDNMGIEKFYSDGVEFGSGAKDIDPDDKFKPVEDDTEGYLSKHRSHGPIYTYKVTDYIIDPVTNEMTLKPDAVGELYVPPPRIEPEPVVRRNPFARKKKDIIIEPIEPSLDDLNDLADNILLDGLDSLEDPSE